MYLVKKWWLLTLFVIAILVILLLALDTYFIFSILNRQENLTLKFYIENIVFFALLGILLLLILMLYTTGKSRTVFRELDKIAEVSRVSTQPIYLYLERLGMLGAKISAINRNLDELNVKKTLKISALSNLHHFLVGRITKRLLVIDPEGKILSASRSLAAEIGAIEAKWQGGAIDRFFPELDLYNLINNLRHTKSVAVRLRFAAAKDEQSSELVTFYPIVNNQNELTYCVGIWQEDSENNRNNSR